MRHWARDRGLLLANTGLFVVFFALMIVAGLQSYNNEQASHSGSVVSLWQYLQTGNFYEATFENWESEFLQMGMYVVLTAYLFQRGSSESKDPDQPAPQDEEPRTAQHRDAPWPVRRGGVVLALYEHSLAGLFFAMFFASFALHAISGAAEYNEDQLEHGDSPISTLSYLTTSRFWFESMQNWQSEFLAVAFIVGASVYLREKRSAESKPVAAPHAETQ
jgi:hypothetical protein